MKWQAGLKQFRESRGLTQLQPDYLDMLSEEISEYTTAVQSDDWYEQVDAICDQLVLTTNCIEQTLPLVANYKQSYWEPEVTKPQLLAHYTGDEPSDDLDTLYRIAELLTDELTSLGVIPALAMKACVKYINGRQQDPAQATEWQADPSLVGTTKWLKDKSQILEKPNYNLCKSKSS